MSNSIPLRYDYMSHLPFFPAEGSKGCEIEEIRDPRGGYIHAKGQKIFTDLESSGHGKKDVGTLVSYRQDEGKTFPCEILHIFMRNICNLDVKVQSKNTICKRINGEKTEN